MLTLLTGTPGSGKTLLAIDRIIKINSNEAKEFNHIEYIYNNIAGFKFERYIDSKIKNEKLEFSKLYVHLTILYKMFLQYESQDNLDDILQDYCKQNNLLNAYFIIDESHNYFDNQDKVKNWWFTYHRHLNHEILLITQNKSLINTQYRNIPELFIKAQPRSKAISKNVLRYFNYTDYRMTQKFSTTEIKINDTYFDLYTSGNISNQKLVGQKLIIAFAIFVIAFILIFVYFVYKFWFAVPKYTPKSEIKETTQMQQKQSIKSNEINENEVSKKLFKFICFENFCYLKSDKETLSLPYSILRKHILGIEDVYIETKTKRLNVYFIADEDTFNFLQGVRTNEKGNNLNFNPLSIIDKYQSGTIRN